MGRANLDEFAATLEELAQADRNIIAVTSDSRGSGKLAPFGKALPKQIVEVGIAEQNLVGITAGLAACGKKVFGVSPACFLTARSLEQIKNDVVTRTCRRARRHQLRRELRRARQHASFAARPRGAARYQQPHDHRSGGQFRDPPSHPAPPPSHEAMFVRFGKAAMYGLHKTETKV
jgi:hypothetical protein